MIVKVVNTLSLAKLAVFSSGLDTGDAARVTAMLTDMANFGVGDFAEVAPRMPRSFQPLALSAWHYSGGSTIFRQQPLEVEGLAELLRQAVSQPEVLLAETGVWFFCSDKILARLMMKVARRLAAVVESRRDTDEFEVTYLDPLSRGLPFVPPTTRFTRLEFIEWGRSQWPYAGMLGPNDAALPTLALSSSYFVHCAMGNAYLISINGRSILDLGIEDQLVI